MANEIVWYHSDETGAPVLNNVAGSLDAVLYACLVTGFRTQTLTSVAVASNVATATLAGHGYADGMMVDHGGTAPTGVSGRKKITVTGSGTYTFDATGAADNAGITGVVAKRSPLGWTRPFNSGNVSLYARSDPTANGIGLRVDDSGAGLASATHARVTMLESLTELSPTTGIAPSTAQFSGGFYWSKGQSSGTAKRWVLFGDSHFFYLLTEGATNSGAFATFGGLHFQWFGDPVRYRTADPYGTLLGGLHALGSDQTSNSVLGVGTSSSPSPAVGAAWCRSISQTGQAAGAGLVTPNSVGVAIGFASNGPLYPSLVDNGVVLSGPVHVLEGNTTFGNPIRGEMPGLYQALARGAHVLHLQRLTDVVGTTRELVGAGVLTGNSSASTGLVAVDVTGPWR